MRRGENPSAVLARVREAVAAVNRRLRARPPRPAEEAPAFALSREGEVWAVSQEAGTVRLKHSRA